MSKYFSEPVASIIDRINRQYFLPAIQREFVWEADQIELLFDSLVRGYPLGSFLFWTIGTETYDSWDVYQFIEEARVGGTHNTLANVNRLPNITLVLDGQQRLTSLLIGLRGCILRKKRGRSHDWVRSKLYLDLFHDPEESDPAGGGPRYAFRFLATPVADERQHWFEVGRILQCSTRERFYQLQDEIQATISEASTKKQSRTFEKNLSSLYKAVWQDDSICYHTDHDEDFDRVLDIFVRANDGGTKLSKSDLLLAVAVSTWRNEENPLNAREALHDFVDHVNNNLPRKNSFDKDFVLKTCLFMTDLPIAYSVKNFTRKNLLRILDDWAKIKSAIESGIRLANYFGLDRDTLVSANALIPLLYFMFLNPSLHLPGSTPLHVENTRRIRRWLLAALLRGVFTGHSDLTLNAAREILKEHRTATIFPSEALAGIRDLGRSSVFNETDLEDILQVQYGKKNTFLALSLLYEEDNWGGVEFHQDHIFPRSLFERPNEFTKGLSDEQRTKMIETAHRLGNLELLRREENEEKNDKDIMVWLATRDSGFRTRHMIPVDDRLLVPERFLEFVAERERLLLARLRTVLIAPQAIKRTVLSSGEG